MMIASTERSQEGVARINGHHYLIDAVVLGELHQSHRQIKSDGSGGVRTSHSGQRRQANTSRSKKVQKATDLILRGGCAAHL